METMNRKEFLVRTTTIGGCCAMAMLAGALPLASEDKPCGESAKLDPRFSTCEHRVDQGQKVITRIMSQLDAQLDQPTREKIMESCGRLCHDGANPSAKKTPTAEEAKGFLDYMHKHFEVREVGDETVVYFKYTQNPRGLKVSEGYCLCPIFEVPPKDVSPTYCHCSVGYVTAIFEQGLGKASKVELTNSVLRGGKSCDFTVRFKTA